MINPLDYLYYKIYVFQSYLYANRRPINHIAVFGIFLLSNVFSIYMLITGMFSKKFAVWSFAIGLIFIILYGNREEIILKKFENESYKSKIIGNIIVILYILFSVISFLYIIKFYIKHPI